MPDGVMSESLWAAVNHSWEANGMQPRCQWEMITMVTKRRRSVLICKSEKDNWIRKKSPSESFGGEKKWRKLERNYEGWEYCRAFSKGDDKVPRCLRTWGVEEKQKRDFKKREKLVWFKVLDFMKGRSLIEALRGMQENLKKEEFQSKTARPRSSICADFFQLTSEYRHFLVVL